MADSSTTEKIGLVIQGPLVSRGRTGISEKSIDFDCSEYVAKQYALGKSLGFEVVLATWDTNFPPQNLGIPDVDILIYENESFLKSLNIYDPLNQRGNKYRQFFLTYMGASILDQRDCGYILKIRTDQEVDLLSFKNFVEAGEPEEGALAFPYWHFEYPNYPNDFYFAGKSKVIINFLNIMLNSREMHANVHLDIFYKWVHNSQKTMFGFTSGMIWWLSYFPKMGSLNPTQLRVVENAWSTCFQTLPSDMWLNLKWRGVPNEYPIKNKDQIFSSMEISREELSRVSESKGLNLDLKEAVGWLLGMRIRFILIKVEAGFLRLIGFFKGIKLDD